MAGSSAFVASIAVSAKHTPPKQLHSFPAGGSPRDTMQSSGASHCAAARFAGSARFAGGAATLTFRGRGGGSEARAGRRADVCPVPGKWG